MDNSAENSLGGLAAKYGKYKLYILLAGAAVIALLGYYVLLSPPRGFPEGTIFNIGQGENLRTVSFELKNLNMIRSRAVFEALIIISGGEKRIIPKDYLFENKVSVVEVARRIREGESRLAPIKITIPEGYNTAEIADLLSQSLPYFDKAKFLTQAREGYLFPDTYFFFTTATETDVLKSLTDNFNKKIATLEKDVTARGGSLEDIIKMASVIEREAKGDADRDIISGILWRRHKIGMPLQADAAPETYERKGLPFKPVANPGLSSIRAAIFPEASPYLYYLHDKEGEIHYAKTFTEHRRNIERYLK